MWPFSRRPVQQSNDERIQKAERIITGQQAVIQSLHNRIRGCEEALMRADVAVTRLQRAIDKVACGSTDVALGMRVARLELLIGETASDSLWREVREGDAEARALAGLVDGKS
jgi:hypothetical protein